MNSIPEIIESAIKLILVNDLESAKDYISQINPINLNDERSEALEIARSLITNQGNPRPKVMRMGVRRMDEAASFERDHFTCRYCMRRTIYIPVLKEISRILPDVFPYHRNWKFGNSHILYWIYSTSLEHKMSFPNGGNSEPDNLITACYLCNDVKKHHLYEVLGWKLNEPTVSEWDGLKRYLPQLKKTKKSNQ